MDKQMNNDIEFLRFLAEVNKIDLKIKELENKKLKLKIKEEKINTEIAILREEEYFETYKYENN